MFSIKQYIGYIKIQRLTCKNYDKLYCNLDTSNIIKCQWDDNKCIGQSDTDGLGKENIKRILTLFKPVIRLEKIKKLLNENPD